MALAYLPSILWGGLNTFKLLGSAMCLAVPLGLLLGLIRYRKVPILSVIAVAYIDFFRTSVALVLICWCYYALPVLIQVNLDTYVAVTLALGLQASAFMAELVRAGLQAVAKGQWEAAKALGMPYNTSLRYIVLPQAFRKILPVFFLLVIEVIKNTSLAGVVTYPELFYNAGTAASTSYRPIEIFTMVGAIYFVIIFSAGQAVRVLERHLARVDR
ncbi:MAG: amino acid ABC transporter permease [Reyranellaceae bacterium]